MSRPNDPEIRQRHEESAVLLGRLAQGLEGQVGRSDDVGARERLLVALAGRRPARFGLFFGLAAACVLSVALLLVFRERSRGIEYSITGPAIAEGEWLGVPPDSGVVALKFSEGTEVDLGPGSKGRVTEVTADGARIVLGGGELHARVVHRPRARWIVSAGPYEIEVTGTAFDVGWSVAGARLEVSLHDGGVVVRGPSLDHGIRVSAGQRLVTHARTGSTELSSLFQPERSAEPGGPAAAAPSAEPLAREAHAPQAAASPSWTELVSSGNFQTVLDAAKARGLDQILGGGSLRDLVALSDAARYAGDRALARRGLLAQRSRFGSSPESQAAAFVLGRMADDAGSVREALEWYDRYLQEAPRGSFAAEALGRRLVALVRAGDAGAARKAAEAYVKRFPRGAHAAYAEDVLRRQ